MIEAVIFIVGIIVSGILLVRDSILNDKLTAAEIQEYNIKLRKVNKRFWTIASPFFSLLVVMGLYAIYIILIN